MLSWRRFEGAATDDGSAAEWAMLLATEEEQDLVRCEMMLASPQLQETERTWTSRQQWRKRRM
jgi:hypothetical protein